MTTLRQIAANQANAKRSTGPTSDEGKARSRANALKHGLSGDGIVTTPDDAIAIAERLESWRPAYELVNPQQEWLFHQIVVNSVRIDRCQRQESAIRFHESARAEVCWDEDRLLAAEELGARLSRNPALVAGKLRRTRQGCLWLLDRWKRLGQILQQEGEWTDAQKSLAMDLLGLPLDLRALGLDSQPQTLVAEQMTVLENLCTQSLDDLDTIEQDAASQGLELTPSKPLSLLRRYEAHCQKELQAARTLLQSRTPAEIPTAVIETPACPIVKEPEPEPEPEPVLVPVPAPVPASVPVPLLVSRTPVRMVSVLAEPPRSLNRHQRRAVESLARS